MRDRQINRQRKGEKKNERKKICMYVQTGETEEGTGREID